MRHVKILSLGIGLLIPFTLTACTIHPKTGSSDPKTTKVIDEVVEANDNFKIFDSYGSVEANVTYPLDEESDTIHTYYSSSVYNYDYQDDPTNFGYLDPTMMIGNSPDSDSPTYGVIVDSDYYSNIYESYKLIHFFGSKDSVGTISSDNVLEFNDGSESYVYNYDKDTLLVNKSTYTFAEDTSPWCIEEYTYNKDNKDAEYTNAAKQYIDNISGGEYVTITINRLDGSTKQYDFPKGFHALFYSNYDYKYDGTEDIYYEQVIDNDVTFIEIEATEFDFIEE